MKNKKYKNKIYHEQSLDEPKILCAFIVLLSFITSLYIRVVPPLQSVLNNPSGTITFAADDAVYHMRIVENLIINFPHKIWFEAFTLYPHGQSIHFGPLTSYMIAVPALIMGLGSPSIELIRTIGALYPAVMGALIVIPVFIIGKEVFNTRVGLLSSFMIAIMPGPFLARSMLGFTDHHAGEAFFSALFIMFLIITVKRVQINNILPEDIRYKTFNWNKIRPTVIISIITGIAFGLYLLQWTSGIFFSALIVIPMFMHIIRGHIRKETTDGFYLLTITSLITSFLIIVCFVNYNVIGFSMDRYSHLHIIATLGCAMFFLFMYMLSICMNKMNKISYFPITIITIVVFGIILIKLMLPSIFFVVTSFFGMFLPKTGGASTIAEAMPVTPEFIQSAFPGIISAFSCYNFALIGMIILIILLINTWKIERLIFIIWSVTLLALTIGQLRWFYYFAINVALLSSFIAIGLLDLVGYTYLTHKYNTIKSLALIQKEQSTRLILSVIVCILIIIMLIMPLYAVSSKSTSYGVAPSQYFQWHESLTWMRYNTPETGLDFNAIYDEDSFNYPNTAYGIMSWWDYGHVITYIGHRIPIANPFQSGIGGGPNNAPGASSFFTTTSEEESFEITNKLGSKYIISDAYMAYSIVSVMGLWNNHDYSMYQQYAIISGNKQSIYTEFWYETMEGKLHIFDGNGLQHYRMVHESVPNPYANGGNAEQQCKALYNILYEGNIRVENTGFIKIFEVVEGATITGTAPNGSTVTIHNEIKTNTNRTFIYTQTTIADNGTYKLIVPYSTTGPINNGTNFNTMPVRPYQIETENGYMTFHVNEIDVLNGNTINLM